MKKKKTVTIIIDNVDLHLLKKQRMWLHTLESKSPEVEGLINLTDAMVDYACDVLDNNAGLLL